MEDVCLRMGSLVWSDSALVPFVGGRPALDVQFSHVLDDRKPVTPSTSAHKDCFFGYAIARTVNIFAVSLVRQACIHGRRFKFIKVPRRRVWQ